MNNNIGIACKITTGKLDANQAIQNGQYPFYTCAEFPDTIDSFAFDDDVVLVAGNNAKGNFHVNRFKGKFNAYQRTYVLTAKKGFDIDFIYYSLKLELKRLKEKSQGSQTKFLTMPILQNIGLKNLSESEQKQISSVLSTLDEKIALNNQINATLEQMAKTLYDYWFVQFDFPDDNGKPYKSSGGEMVYNEILKREIPKGWEVKILNSLGEIVGGSTPSTTKAENFSLTDGTPWITPYDLSQNQGNKYITRGETNVTNQGIIEASLKKYPAGTVLMSSRAPIGYMAIAKKEVTTNQGFKSFIPNKGYDTEFVYYAVFNSMKAITQSASGSTFKEISTTVLKSIPVALPPKELAKTYFEKASNIFNEQDNLEQQNGELTKLRDWLLPMLMNGQVTVQ